jgi:hypothetical protein
LSRPVHNQVPTFSPARKRKRQHSDTTDNPHLTRTGNPASGAVLTPNRRSILMKGGSFSTLPMLLEDTFDVADQNPYDPEEEDTREEDDSPTAQHFQPHPTGRLGMTSLPAEGNADDTAPLQQTETEAKSSLLSRILSTFQSPSTTATTSMVQQQASASASQTTLTEAAATGDLELMKELLKQHRKEPENRTDPNHTDKKGRTPLIAAAEAGQEAVVDFLLDPENPLLLFRMDDDLEPHHLVILNHSDLEGNTAFMHAAKNNHPSIMKKLMNAMGDEPGRMIEAQNGKGETALMLAAANGNTAGVKLILKEDVRQVRKDTNDTYVPSYKAHDERGKSAMRHALDNNQVKCAYLIQEYRKYIDWIA